MVVRLVAADTLEHAAQGLTNRKLISCDKKGQLNDFALNGGEVVMLYNDIRLGKQGTKPGEDCSAFLHAFYKVHASLGIDDTTAHLDDWAEVFMHWANAMHAAYKLKPTAADRDTFTQEVRWYVLKKAAVKNDGLRWYDWQFYSLFPKLFYMFGSLRLLSQEVMEAQMALNSRLLQRSNGFSNAGRRSLKAIREGTTAAYMAARKALMRTPWQWLWERQLLAWIAPYSELFTRLEEAKRTGRVKDYEGDAHSYVEAHRSFKRVSPVALKHIARARARHAPNRPSLAALASSVAAHVQDLEADVDRARCMDEEDGRKYLLMQRKKRWKSAKGEGSGKQLLHADLPVPGGEKVVHAMFGRAGRYPTGCGRKRVCL